MRYTFLKSKTFWVSILAGVIALIPAIEQAGLSHDHASVILSFLVALNRVSKDL